MTDSLRDQLLHLGFKQAPAPERKPERRPDAAARRGPGGRGDAGPRRDRPGQGAGKQGSGSAPQPQPQREPRKGGGRGRAGEMDLGKAYALRAEHEKRERIEAEQRRQEEARLRREARAKLDELLKDKALNDPAAEIARHFDYGGKIKRIYVTEAQLKALNAGELGVVQSNGRYLLVSADLLVQAEAIFAAAIALKVDPAAPVEEPAYSDPKFQVPDDLVW